MCVPYDQLNEILDFEVLKMTDIINQVNFNPKRIPDHSILLCEIKVRKLCNKRNSLQTTHESVTNTRKYRVNNIPDNFLVDNVIRDTINETIYRIENAIHVKNNVHSSNDDFCILIQDEMDNKLPRTKHKTYNNNCGKSRYKPYWNDIL